MRLDCNQTKKLIDMKTYRRTLKNSRTRKKSKKPTLSLVNAGPPDRVSVLSTKYERCHPKGIIVASSHKIKQIVIITILTLMYQSQFSVLLDKNKNQLKLYSSYWFHLIFGIEHFDTEVPFLSSSPKLNSAYK